MGRCRRLRRPLSKGPSQHAPRGRPHGWRGAGRTKRADRAREAAGGAERDGPMDLASSLQLDPRGGAAQRSRNSLGGRKTPTVYRATRPSPLPSNLPDRSFGEDSIASVVGSRSYSVASYRSRFQKLDNSAAGDVPQSSIARGAADELP